MPVRRRVSIELRRAQDDLLALCRAWHAAYVDAPESIKDDEKDMVTVGAEQVFGHVIRVFCVPRVASRWETASPH